MGHIAHKAVLIMLVEQLAEAFYGFRLLPQDLFDSLASHMSAALAMCLFALVMARMFLYDSIHCFVPAEWPDPWEQAAEAYCYMEGAYAVPWENLNKTGPDAWAVKVPQTYYYWLPFILLALSVLLKVPDLLWGMYCQQSSKQPAQTLKAVAFLTEGTESAEGKKAERLSRLLGDHLMSESDQLDFRTSRLFWAYMMSKALRLLATLGSLVYLQHSFGLSSPLFGVLAWTSSGLGSSDGVPSFPTVTFCDVALRHLGQWNTRTVQCVLPINLLLDKIALFLWFWLVACSFLCLASAVVWIVRVGVEARRRRYLKTFVQVLQDYRRRRRSRLRRSSTEEVGEHSQQQQQQEQQQQQQQQKEKHDRWAIIRAFNTVDRVFLLRLIQDRLGMTAAYLVMEAMTMRYESRQDSV